MNEPPKLFVATKAFIVNQEKVLLIRESDDYQDGTNHGKYDVPGGRVKPGQRFDVNLKREVKEETGLEIKIKKPFFVNEWQPVINNEQWQIIGIYFECQTNSDKITLSHDHDDYLWINPKDYQNYNLIEDLKPVFEAFLKSRNAL